MGPSLGLAAHYEQLKAGFPDIPSQSRRRSPSATSWQSAGPRRRHHQGDHLGPPATNKRVTVTGRGFARFRDGKIVEAWNNWEMMGLMRAIGQTLRDKVL
ncbi:MAG: ester cyclase [Thiohalocapsa sp.]